MGEKRGFGASGSGKIFIRGQMRVNIDSVLLIQLRKNGSSGRRSLFPHGQSCPSMDLIHMLSVSSGA